LGTQKANQQNNPQTFSAFRFKRKGGCGMNFKGENNPNWKGGQRIDKDGYVLVYSPNHPNKDKNNLVRKHRLVLEKYLGRFLDSFEQGHHCDGNKKNNLLSNIELTNQAEHNRIHHKGNKYLLGHKHTEETKRKIAKAGKGRKHSDKTKIKMSEKAKDRWFKERYNL
jgi:hypothetical protein